MSAEFRPTRLLARLSKAGVDFVVIGGIAVVAQANPRFTKDLDITYAPDHENLERLAGVLAGIHARLRGIGEDVPFVPDARTLSQMEILTLETDDGALDLLLAPPGSPGYQTLAARADAANVDGTTFLVASIDDLLAMKRAAGRPQDLIDIEALEVAKRLLAE